MQVRGALLPNLATTSDISESLPGLVAPAGTVGFLPVAVAVGAVSGGSTPDTLLLGAVCSVGFLVTTSRVPTYAVFLLALLGQRAARGLSRGLDRAVLSHTTSTPA